MDQTEYFQSEFYDTDFTTKGELAKLFETCEFVNCNFSNLDLGQIVFEDCTFKNCDFALVNTHNSAFKNVFFEDCKLKQLRFDSCSNFLLKLEFKNCTLQDSSFYQVNLARHEFHDCNLTEVDFTEAILIDSTFNNCNLGGAIFDNTHLERADFRTAVNFQIDPANNKMKGAKFSINGLANLLVKYKLDIE
ncbi:MAG: fluoroquinolone resistance protein [Chitinophagales bacterium]|jgi:fluoroquinolone resistance protein